MAPGTRTHRRKKRRQYGEPTHSEPLGSTMPDDTLLIHPEDDLLVILRDLPDGTTVYARGEPITLNGSVQAKHKIAIRHLRDGQPVRMYGMVVGRARQTLAPGQAVTVANLEHAVQASDGAGKVYRWAAPDVAKWKDRQLLGYVREDGRVGLANYWIVVPLVFCQNRNLQMMAEALVEELGYGRSSAYRQLTRWLLEQHRADGPSNQIASLQLPPSLPHETPQRPFPNVDGVKFLRHELGCGGTYEDAVNLCGLLAGYIDHPNVAGATVLSLGCQKSQVQTLEDQLHRRNPGFSKPLHIFEQQQIGSEQTLLERAIHHTVAGIMQADRLTRQPAGLEHLVMGVECGGSDGFSGISANPSIGHCSDLIVALGGSVILSEFPELAGCEHDFVRRCLRPELGERFLDIMQQYDRRAQALGGGFHDNPSPGNIRDGLITDAMKSAGAARKGGTSPVTDVLDYPEPVKNRGLNLLCTPGGDVESTTAMASSGANIQVFSTGLGTPTGNPITAVLKVSTNSSLAAKMPDIIDLDAGPVITGQATIEQIGEQLLELVIRGASGQYLAKAQRLGQDDFIPWKRGLSF